MYAKYKMNFIESHYMLLMIHLNTDQKIANNLRNLNSSICNYSRLFLFMLLLRTSVKQ